MYEKVLSDLRSGIPVLLYDEEKREGETDMVVASQFVTPDVVRRMRKDAGGYICTTVREGDARLLGLPLMQEFLSGAIPEYARLFDQSDLRYDKSSPFSFTINHRNTFTGISDEDRSLTIREFSSFLSTLDSSDGRRVEFQKNFRCPGHVNLIIARDGYFSRRRGHTELSTFMAEEAGLTPSATVVEMLSDTGKSMNKEEAIAYAERNSLTFIEGKEIIAQWANGQNNGLGRLRPAASRSSALPS